MNDYDPIALMFGGMDKLGPGDDGATRQVLASLPRRDFEVVVDAGCGAGRQTLVLAAELQSTVHAVDTFQPFLDSLLARAAQRGIDRRIATHCRDIQDIPGLFPRIDLLWSEGAAYNIGFTHALATWAKAIVPGGYCVVSELTWLANSPPREAAGFFAACYPAMQSLEANIAACQRSGYRLLSTHTLAREAWTAGYYDVLRGRANSLAQHVDAGVRAFAAETLKEIDVFEHHGESYGYVFYALERTGQ